MIIVKLMGGLGNQLFQYALGRQLAIENRTELRLDVSGYAHQESITPRAYGLGVFSIDAQIASNKEIDALKYPNRLFAAFGVTGKGYTREYTTNLFDERILRVGDNKYLEGYWQTERYFKDIADILRAELILKSNIESIPADIIRDMQNTNSVSVHIRRGDYVTNKSAASLLGVLPLDYYMRAFSYISDKVQNPVFFVFTDDVDWVKKHISVDGVIKFVSCKETKNGSKDYEELVAMGLCKHNIIANSSFSWWGAWLNKNPNKIIIAPRNWFSDPNAKIASPVPAEWIAL